MSSISLFNAHTLQSKETAKEAFAAYWRGRSLQQIHLGFSASSIAHVAFRALGVLTAATAATFLVLGLCSIVVVAHYVIIPLCVLASIFSFVHASHLKNEQEAKQLASMRADIENLSLVDIARRYSWNEIFTFGILTPDEFAYGYRKQLASMPLGRACNFYEKMVRRLEDCQNPKYIYYIPSPSELREKWALETQNKTFVEIIEGYSLEQLQKHKILSVVEFKILTELNVFFQTAKHQRDTATHQRFPEIVSRKEELRRGFQDIEKAYRENPSVNRLELIEPEHNLKRDAITNRYAQQKKQEKEEAYVPCSVFLDQHKRSFLEIRLKQQDQIELEVLKKQYSETVAQIDIRIGNAVKREIEQIDQRYSEERIRLVGEVALANQEREARKIELAAQIQECDVIDQGIDQRFQNIVKDVNCRYNAQRQILRSHI